MVRRKAADGLDRCGGARFARGSAMLRSLTLVSLLLLAATDARAQLEPMPAAPPATAPPAAAPLVAAPPADDPLVRLRALPPLEMDEVTWLARCLVTESNRPREQWYVAWVVRNRVETRFAGSTYREVVLEPFQFSAFNAPSAARDDALALTPLSEHLHWREAVRIALDVTRADASRRPFPVTVRHFYSPVSMEGGKTPTWAQGRAPVVLDDATISDRRFRFYDGLDAQSPVARLHPTAVDAAYTAPIEMVEPRRSSIRDRRSTRVSIGRPARPAGPKRPTRRGG